MLDLDTFTGIIDKHLTEQEVKLLIELPKGTEEATIRGGTGVATVDLFVILSGMKTVMKGVLRDMGGSDKLDVPGALDGMLGLVKASVLEELGIEGGEG